jgi:hypothetical protein
MIKDLIISGDSTLQEALDSYEKGESKALQGKLLITFIFILSFNLK